MEVSDLADGSLPPYTNHLTPRISRITTTITSGRPNQGWLSIKMSKFSLGISVSQADSATSPHWINGFQYVST